MISRTKQFVRNHKRCKDTHSSIGDVLLGGGVGILGRLPQVPGLLSSTCGKILGCRRSCLLGDSSG